ncbi:MAG: hypothetical protein E6Q97_20330 [Desulfurellales bacterium]|nr:MAG: hypothetical protein E6Q97_20330 [Desulfurellales bacterium]
MSEPILFGDVCMKDSEELRDIAEYFESRGKPMQGEFLRNVAARHEVLAGAYSTANTTRNAAFDFFAWFNKTYPTAPSNHHEHPWCVLGSLMLERDTVA